MQITNPITVQATAIGQVLDPQPESTPEMNCRVERVKVSRVQTHFTENDLVMREFRVAASRRVVRTGKFRAA